MARKRDKVDVTGCARGPSDPREGPTLQRSQAGTHTPRLVRGLLGERQRILGIALLAGALALAINLLAALTVAVLGIALSTALAASLVIAALAYGLATLARAATVRTSIETLTVYQVKSRDVLPVPEYWFSTECVFAMSAVFEENAALRNRWHAGELAYGGFASDAAVLFRELLEYVVLRHLSLHLSNYFRDDSRRSLLVTLGREDIPSVLLTNHFLGTMSTPISDRPGFPVPGLQPVEGPSESVLPERDRPLLTVVRLTLGQPLETGEVVSASYGGRAYQMFELVLPRGSMVSRQAQRGSMVSRQATHSIRIDSPFVELTVSVQFIGTNVGAPDGFMELYVGVPHEEVRDLSAVVNVSARVKPRALMNPHLGFYGWVDSWLGKLEHDFAINAFLTRIQWDAVQATVRGLNRQLRLRAEAAQATDKAEPPDNSPDSVAAAAGKDEKIRN